MSKFILGWRGRRRLYLLLARLTVVGMFLEVLAILIFLVLIGYIVTHEGLDLLRVLPLTFLVTAYLLDVTIVGQGQIFRGEAFEAFWTNGLAVVAKVFLTLAAYGLWGFASATPPERMGVWPEISFGVFFFVLLVFMTLLVAFHLSLISSKRWRIFCGELWRTSGHRA